MKYKEELALFGFYLLCLAVIISVTLIKLGQ